jgi:hypothetical protein
MLEMKITTKQQLMKLLQGSDIKVVIAKDIGSTDDLDQLKKSGQTMLRNGKSITAFLVAS